MLISDNLPGRKSYFDSNIMLNEIQVYCDVYSEDYFEADVARSQIFTYDVTKARNVHAER